MQNIAGTRAFGDTPLAQGCSPSVRALLAPLQLALDGLADELGPLVRPGYGVDPRKRILCQSDDCRSNLHRRAAHK